MPDSALLTFGNHVWVPEQGLDEKAGGAKYCAFNRQMPSASFFFIFFLCLDGMMCYIREWEQASPNLKHTC